MAQPRLLLIDDEPALAQFLATAAEDCGFQPVITSRDVVGQAARQTGD